MPNPMFPNLQTSLPNTMLNGASQPGFFGAGGGFQQFGTGLRSITRQAAAGFAKDPRYREMAAQQIAYDEQAQREQAAQVKRAILEASLDSLGQLAESMKGVGSQKITSSPSTMQMIERSVNNAVRAMVAAGWPEEDAVRQGEQYKWTVLQSADIQQPNELEQKIATLREQFPGISDDELKKSVGALVEQAEDKGEERTLMLGDGQTVKYKVFQDGTTDLTTKDGRRVMASEIEKGETIPQPSAGDYRTQLAQDESSGGKVTENPLNKNVSGKYQVSGQHWPQLEGLDDESKLTVILNTNAQEFKGAFNKEPTDADQYGMHRLGTAGYQQLLAAPVGADVVDVVGDVVVEDNPDLSGKTVGDVLSEWKSRYGGGTTWRNKGGAETDVISELREPAKKEPLETKQIYDPNSPTGIRIVTEEEAIGQPGVPPAQAAAMENKADKEWEDRQTAVKVFEAQAERIKKKLAKGTAVGGVSSLVQTIAGIGAQVEMLGEALGVDASIADPEQYIGEMPPEAADMSAALQSDIVGLAYSMALAQNGNRVTNEDVKRALQQIGDSGMLSDPSQIAAALDSSLDAMYTGLEAEAEARERTLTIKRKNAPQDENIPEVKTDADFIALPSGTKFKDPEGNIRIKP